MQKYMKDKGVISLDSSMNLVSEALRRSAGVRDDARFRLVQIDEKMKQIESYRAENRNLLEIADIGTHVNVAPLKTRLNNLESEMKLLAERYFERHPNYSFDLIHVAAVAIRFQAVKQRTVEMTPHPSTATCSQSI